MGDVTTYIVELSNNIRIEALLPNSVPAHAKLFEIGDAVMSVGKSNLRNSCPISSLSNFSNDMQTSNRLVKWLISGPPLLFLLVFFVAPGLIMIFTSFRLLGEFGGVAPIEVLPGEVNGDSGLTIETYQFFFSDFIYIEIFLKSFAVAAFTTLICITMARIGVNHLINGILAIFGITPVTLL